MSRKRNIEKSIVTTLKAYGGRVPFSLIMSHINRDMLHQIVLDGELRNALNRLRRRRIINGGMRYKHYKGWRFTTRNERAEP